MKYLLFAAAAAILPAALPVDAMAGGPNPDIQIINNNYIINDNFNAGPNVRRGNYDYDYRRDYGYDYRPYRYRGYSSRGFETHNEAVARIRATHSRYRTNYHPRSYYNSPPHHYDW